MPNGEIISVSLETVGTITGFDESDLSFTANELVIDLSGPGGWGGFSSATITFETNHSEIPEPNTFLLLGSASLALLGLRRRGNRS